MIDITVIDVITAPEKINSTTKGPGASFRAKKIALSSAGA